MNKNNDDIKYYSAAIQKYLAGKMSAAEMHAMEKAALEDPFLADALEGYAIKSSEENAGDLADLRKKLAGRRDGKVVPFYKGSWFKSAAAVIFIAVGLSLVYMLLVKTDQRQLADNKMKTDTGMDTIKNIMPLPLPSSAAPVAEAADKTFNAKEADTSAKALSEKEVLRQYPNTQNELSKQAAPALKAPVAVSVPSQVIKDGDIRSMRREDKAKISYEKEDFVFNDTTELKEVVVSGYKSMKKSETTGSVSSITANTLQDTSAASPVIGMDAYRAYIISNKKIPASETETHGNILINFAVKKSGCAHDFKILKSLSPLLDQEATRLIKEGPKWKRKNKTGRTTITISF